MVKEHSRKLNKWQRAGLSLVRLASGIVDLIMLGALLLCLLIGFYALWDTNQVYSAADSKQFERYKPSADDTVSFEELRQNNKEVIGWITLYGTGIDYPIVQAEDNTKYLTMDASGKFAASGSIYLDYRNKSDFSDFNSIVYGHHMAESAMFGDIGNFAAKTYFDSHRYGYLFADGREYGLEMFAMLEIDAYNSSIYQPGIQAWETQTGYLESIASLAMFTRETSVTTEDRIVLLSTCTEDITNGRHVLVAKLLDAVPANPYEEPQSEPTEQPFRVDNNTLPQRAMQIPAFMWVLLFLILLLFILAVYSAFLRAARRKTNHAKRREQNNVQKNQ